MGYDDGLGKHPRLLATGEPLTREQANEVMMRTIDWSFVACNDAEWQHMVASILGWYDRHDEVCDDDECVQYWAWVREHRAITEVYGQSIGALGLESLANESIMSSGHRDRHDGWLRWDGTVRGSWIADRYTEIDDLAAEVAALAEAFPFLSMHVQALSCGFSSSGIAAPKGTVVVEWFIRDGRVKQVRIPWQEGYQPRRIIRQPWTERWQDWQYGQHWSARAVRRVTWSKAWRLAAKPYRKLRRWRRSAHLNYEFFPREFDWGMPVFKERYVSAARLIEADDQMRGKKLS